MADPPPVKEAIFTGEFDGLAVPTIDHTFYALHMTETYQNNINNYPMKFRNIGFSFDDIIFDASFNDIFPNPTDDDAFQMPNHLPDCLGSELGLDSVQMNPNSFGQPGSQLMGSFGDASGTFKSTSGDCLGEASGSNPIQMDPNCFGQPRNELIGKFRDSSRNSKLTLEEMNNFAGNQVAGGVMVMDMSSSRLLHSWSNSGVLDELSPSLHQVSTDVSGYLNLPSPNYGSNLSKGLNNLSDSNKSVHASQNLGSNSVKGGVVEQKLNANISNCSSLLKRKKGSEDLNNVSKHQKSTIFSLNDNVNNDEDEKRMTRLIRNRESAHLSRQRKKHYVEELEDKVRTFYSIIQHLNAKISYEMAENATLKAQLRDIGVPPQVSPPTGMHPHPPPWMSSTPPYMMKLQGSQVPLVPIPKLKPQSATPAPKSSKKVEKKKSEVKTKKVASVSFLGVLFFMLFFGGLVPLLNVRYGGMREPFLSGDSSVSGFYEKHHGRVLTIDRPVNETGYSGKYDGKDHSSHCGGGGQGESNQQNTNKSANEFVHVGNGSDPLAASLYVPRNDKLVKIDGNLIIQSVLASEKAMASHGSADKKNREAGLAVPGDLAPAIPGIHPHLFQSPAVRQRVLGSKRKEISETSAGYLICVFWAN